jgi:hypothetical protein
MGETFASNPVTGTASMSVPIATSPGRSGFGPNLSLTCDSGSGNGPFGFGWSLSLPVHHAQNRQRGTALKRSELVLVLSTPAKHETHPVKSGLGEMERAKRLELSTSTLARWCSTN